jgi:hypothetical protein
MTVPYQKIYRANALSLVKCEGERKKRNIRKHIELSEGLYNLPKESLDQFVTFAYTNKVNAKHYGDEVFYNKETGYLIEGVEYWSEE